MEVTVMASASIPIDTPRSEPLYANSMVTRYVDAYRSAAFQTKLGGTVKFIAFLFGAIVGLLSLLVMLTGMSQQSFGPNPLTMFGFSGLISGIVGGFLGWVLGVMISSQGQMLKATLDAAVNSSPFIQNSDRVKIMSLKPDSASG
jgi:uncharacterized membrane protein required for colicin V production